MRILVISLLRIGDVAMSAGVLRDLRTKYPSAEIDLLINSQSSQIASLLPSVNRVVELDRTGLQKGLGEANRPFFESYEKLNETLEALSESPYDLSINLTQNRLSGWLMGLIDSREKIGLTLDQAGQASFHSNWFRYLNTQIDLDGAEVFHFNDIFRFALGVSEIEKSGAILRETPTGRAEAARLREGRTGELVCVQAITSDQKKDWSLAKFEKALTSFSNRHPEVDFAILAAPFEREKLQPLVDRLVGAGKNAFLAVSSFEGAFSLVSEAKLTITLDTSIKHLAAAAGTPILEICLGSSDPHRTGADLSGAVIVKSRETCAPCSHSKACHREKQFCADRISPEAVALLASEVYSKRKHQLPAIALEFSDEIVVYQVDRTQLGLWAAVNLAENFSEAAVSAWLDLVCKKVWIDSKKPSQIELGTEMLRLSNFFKSTYPKVSEIEWRHLLEDFEKRAMDIESRINGFKAGIRFLHGTYEDPNKMREFVRGLISFREKTRNAPLFGSFKNSLDQVIEDDISAAFTRFRRIHDVVHEIEARTKTHLRILRAITLQLDNSNLEQERL